MSQHGISAQLKPDLLESLGFYTLQIGPASQTMLNTSGFVAFESASAAAASVADHQPSQTETPSLSFADAEH